MQNQFQIIKRHRDALLAALASDRTRGHEHLVSDGRLRVHEACAILESQGDELGACGGPNPPPPLPPTSTSTRPRYTFHRRGLFDAALTAVGSSASMLTLDDNTRAGVATSTAALIGVAELYAAAAVRHTNNV